MTYKGRKEVGEHNGLKKLFLQSTDIKMTVTSPNDTQLNGDKIEENTANWFIENSNFKETAECNDS